PAQLLENLSDRFELANVGDSSGYWESTHVGRGLSRLDWDGDGKLDFVVTHLGESSALLVNRTESKNNWIQLRLRGVESERDAIGARIALSRGEVTDTRWVVSGDGFFSRNEAVVCFGLGDATAVDEIRVTWPSGKSQVVAAPSINQRYLVIENEIEPFSL
ncbi:MAG: ASPIC/UnbV domain-containing protein, partial [Planctomycetota bacterium]